MSGFLQTLAGGAVGVGAVLAAQHLPALWSPGPAGPPAVTAPGTSPAADAWGPGAVLLAADPASCPAGWVAVAQVALATSPDYPDSEAQPRATPAPPTALTAGWGYVPFTLCRQEGG